MTLMGLMLIFTGFYAFYAACLVIASTAYPGWANIYLSPTTLGSIAMIITFGFAGGFTGGYFAARGDPFWTVSGGLAGVIGVSAGADVYAPTLGYLIAMLFCCTGRVHRQLDREEGARRRRGRSGGGTRRRRASWGSSGWAYSPPDTRPGSTTSTRASGDSCSAWPPSFRSASSAGWVASSILKKLNLLRVPAEVELDGLDTVEYAKRHHVPEFAQAEDLMIESDGTRVPAEEGPI